MKMKYDSNLCLCGRMAKQTVELTFQVDDYFAKHTTTIGGNALGFSVIESAVENVFDDLGGEDGELKLKRANGDELLCELWEHELKDMLVEARITSIKPDKAANKKWGAPPLFKS
jgi:hypothetical protein